MIRNRSQLVTTRREEVALECLESGIRACHPRSVFERSVNRIDEELRIDDHHIDLEPFDEIIVIGGGKAGGQMARCVEDVLGERLTDGVVVSTEVPETEIISIRKGAHPVPSEENVEATEAILSMADAATTSTLVLCLISGGGSALMCAPAADLTLDDLRTTTNALLESGATIHEINTVRKHLSEIKGGRLAQAIDPATTIGIVLSDVVGNDLDVIASGPLVPDGSTFEEAKQVIERYALDLPKRVSRHIEAGVDGEIAETPAPRESAFESISIHLLADGLRAVRAAADRAADAGYTPMILSSRIEGEARESAKTHVAIAEESYDSGHPTSPPVAFVSGGETTVTIRGDGSGGPNQEFVVSAGLTLHSEDITVASVDTDGIDGPTSVAGGIVTGSISMDADEARRLLDENDAYRVLDTVDGVIETGPTGTNVNDLRIVLVDPS